ncbi:MAG TPA: DNA-3-methyladenine glycosylase [Acidimicrobiales bacterium]|nr:DNA-3-methyladenine glycosylase [Acidimicrobiales bacterium]
MDLGARVVSGSGSRLGREFYERHPTVVAPDLLNKVLVNGHRRGRIVEVEAYAAGADSASHAHRGRTNRNASMYGPPGLLYVYFVYGMHWCANAVCFSDETAGAVLLRALEPLCGIEEMRDARAKCKSDRDLSNGPAKLCQAMGIDGTHDGTDMAADGKLMIVDDGMAPPGNPGNGVRVGIKNASDIPWRWWVGGNAFVSRPDGK